MNQKACVLVVVVHRSSSRLLEPVVEPFPLSRRPLGIVPSPPWLDPHRVCPPTFVGHAEDLFTFAASDGVFELADFLARFLHRI